MDENIGQSDDQQNDLQEQEEVEEHQQQNGEHSICANFGFQTQISNDK
jgi:hypothetical protein